MRATCEDFVAEGLSLASVMGGLRDADFRTGTAFQGWTLDDVLVHLHLWNGLARQALTDPSAVRGFIGRWMATTTPGDRRALENAEVGPRGVALLDAWKSGVEELGMEWKELDPRRRVTWAGPEMSLRTALTARLMETWAHGQAVFDVLGIERPERDSVRHVALLGAQTYGWSFAVHGARPPGPMPAVRLTLPSGATLDLGGDPTSGLVEGAAVEFAQVVAQTRNVEDTALQVTDGAARRWMAVAQCFAGPPAVPPPPGTRFRRGCTP